MYIYTNCSITYRIFVSLFIGIIVGFVGGIVRLGWEVLFPLHLQDSLGKEASMLFDFLHIDLAYLQLSYVFQNGYEWHVLSMAWQFGFSLFFSLIYVLFAEFWLRLKFGFGIFYGIFLWLCVYVAFLPMLGFVFIEPDSMMLYYGASFVEMILWIWIIELTRRDLRNRITQELDPI